MEQSPEMFADLFSWIVKMFELWYYEGIQLFQFFATPITDEMLDSIGLGSVLNAFVGYTWFEIFFGAGVPLVISLTLARIVLDFMSPF